MAIDTIRIKDLEEVSVNDLDRMWIVVDSADPDSTNKVKLSAFAAYVGGVSDGKYIPLAGSSEITGSLIPKASKAHALGSDEFKWSAVHSGEVHAADVLSIPHAAPSNPVSGKIYLWCDTSGNYAETPGGGGTATVYDLYLKRGSVTIGPYNVGTQEETADLASLFAGYATESWVSSNFNNYTLPIASASTLGGVKIGSGLTIDANGVLSFSGSVSDLATKEDIATLADGVASDSARLTTIEDWLRDFDIEDLVPSWALSSSKPGYALNEISGTDDLRAIEALTGTSGLLKKTAANTWSLDTSTYLTASNHAALTLKVGTATVGSDFNSLAAKTYTITKQHITDTIGDTTYAAYNADGYVPTTRKVNGHALSADVTISIADVIGSTAIGSSTQPIYYTGSGFAATDLSQVYAAYHAAGYVTIDTAQTITGTKKLKAVALLNIPSSAPSSGDAESGKVYLWCDTSGNYSETPSGGGSATIYKLYIKRGSVTVGPYDLGTQDETADISSLFAGYALSSEIPTALADLSDDSTHRLVTDTQISNWGIAYTNNHTHSNKSVLDGIGSSDVSNWNAAYGWGDHSQAGYLTSIPKATTSTLGGIIVGTGLSIDSSGVLSFSADLSSYATIAYTDAQDALLAEGIASNSNRLTTIEDWFREFDIEDLVPAWSLKPAKPAYTPKEIFGSSSIGDSTTPVYFNGTTLVAASLANKYVTLDTTQTITGSKAMKAISLLNIPTSAPSSPESGKVYLWADTSGNYAETPGGGGTATVYNLYLKRGSVTIGPYNLGVQDQTADLASLFAGYALSTEIPTALSDLTDDSTHRLVTDTQITAWAAAATASHSHSNKSVLDGISSTNVTNWGTAYTRTDVQDNSYLMYDGGGHLMVDWQAMEQEVESYLSLGDASLKDYTASVTSGSGDLVTSGAVYSALQNYALASSVPTKVSDLTNDSGFISASYADGQDAVIAEGIASISARIASIEDWFRNPSLDEITADRFNGKLSFSNVVDAPDLTAIEALTGTSGLLKKTAANTWSLVAANLDNIADGSTRKLANYLPLAGGTMTGVINSMNILPKANNTYDLGSSSKKFKDIYSSGTVFADGALAIPTSAPSNPVSGKVYFWCDTSGSYAETPQAS